MCPLGFDVSMFDKKRKIKVKKEKEKEKEANEEEAIEGQ